MKQTIPVLNLSDGYSTNESVELASACPHCGVHLNPNVLNSVLIEYAQEENNKLFIFNYCSSCEECFISRHIFDEFDGSGYYFHSSAPLSHFENTFSEGISKLSPDFVSIFNQSLHAEELGLTDICGMGYRKALEYLVKDFIISQKPEEKDVISSKMLSSCINEYISDPRLKTLAKASAWLGNDETHYVRKHTDYNLQNLKAFINAFVTVIDSELAYEEATRLLSVGSTKP